MAGDDAFVDPAVDWEPLLATALAHVPNAVVVADAGGAILWVNRAFGELSGYQADEVVGAASRLLKSGVQGGDVHEDLWSTISSGRTWRGEVVNRHRDGTPYTVSQSVTPILDDDGTVTHVVAIHEDMSGKRQASQSFQAQLLEAVGEAVIATDTAGHVLYWNDAAVQLYGWRADEVMGRSLMDVTVVPDLAHETETVMAAVAAGKVWSGQSVGLRRDGSTFAALVTNSPIVDETGGIVGVIGVTTDISDLTSAHKLLAHRVAQQAAIADLGRYALASDDIVTVAKAAETTITDALGREHWHARVDVVGEPGSAGAGTALVDGALNISVGVSATVSVWSDDHTELPPHDVAFVRNVANLLDAMFLRAAARTKFEHLATHDPLTKLANRTLFLDRLEQVRASAQQGGLPYEVLLLDLDRFKFVNDGLGHDIGDELLLAVVERLCDVLRPGDTLARLGGDEFAVLSPDIPDKLTAMAMGTRIQGALAPSFHVGETELTVTASIGVAVGDGDADGNALLRSADAAMNRAKAKGRNRIEFFDEDMQHQAKQHIERVAGLRRALDDGAIEAHYQPIIDLTKGQIVGVEALARWRLPSGELVRPIEFIELAEYTGLIQPLGRHILETACREGLAWTRSNPGLSILSVNISPRQFAHGDLTEMVLEVLGVTGFDPDLLHLEITESALMSEPDVRAIMTGLREYGIKFAVDDFGTGYSSLSNLRDLPVEILKIDHSFVSRMTTSPQDRAVVTAALDLARSFGLATIAEGVETPEQVDVLTTLGCKFAQGHLWSPATDAGEISRLLRRAG